MMPSPDQSTSGNGLLQEILDRYAKLPPDRQQALAAEAARATKHLKWTANPGPQQAAYYSKADVLLYGGEPGGGKSQLLLGLALNEHENSLIMRRQYTDLDSLCEAALAIHGSRDGFNGSSPPTLRHERGVIRFGAASKAGDEQQWMGRARDLLGLDEATQFLESQVRFLMGWVRSTTPGQRCRTVFATNPPMSADGVWVFKMFAPWIDPTFPNPAAPGELRWAVVDHEDRDIWVDGPGEYDIGGGEMRAAESRTYIHSSVADNPELAATDYKKRLDALPAEVRRILMGGFRALLRDDPWQVIPTSWVQAAFKRWTPEPPLGIPMTAIAADPAAGGGDKTTLAPRHDWWYAPLVSVPGVQTPLGRDVAGLIVANRRHQAKIVIDMGGGYGGGPWECLLDNVERDDMVAYNGAHASTARTKDGKLGFVNKRAETYWKFREALDPDQPNGSPIALQEDPELLGDLTAVTFEVTPRGIKCLPKDSQTGDSVKKRLGRSPDKGDAVVMAWSAGDKLVPKGRAYTAQQGGRRLAKPTVNLGPRRQRK
jgi:hypothetical protein